MVTYNRMIGENHYINEKAMSIMDAVNEHKDVCTENPVSVIAAGFPCQAFSIAGERRGFDDARGTVIHDIFEVINLYDDESKPDVIFLENVKNFKTHDDGGRVDVGAAAASDDHAAVNASLSLSLALVL